MRALILTVVGYMICTFAVQGTSHFVLNVDHYAAIPHLRSETIVVFGVASMAIQGVVLSLMYRHSTLYSEGLKGALLAGWALGAVILSYIVLAEYGKYQVESFAAWALVEVSAGVVQFTLAGLVLFFAHKGIKGASRAV